MENKIYGRIYLITNLVNGKQYVGQTTSSLKLRFNRHFWDSKYKKTYIAKAINKYNKNNFRIEEIDIAYNQTQLNIVEAVYISWFNTLAPNGYNLVNFSNKGQCSQQTRDKLKIIANHPKNLKLSSEKGKKLRGIPYKNSSSKYVGVTKTKYSYKSNLSFNNKTVNIGHYSTEIEAAKAYDIKAIELYGQNCNLNFPELKEYYINNQINIIKKTNHNYSSSGEKYIFFCKNDKRWIFRWYNKQSNKRKQKSFINIQDAVEYRDFIFSNLNNSPITRKIKN